MIIRQSHKDEVDKIIEFYRSQNYHGGDTMDGNEFTLIAESDERIIGAVRLVEEENVLVLRGMFIDKPFQRQGIGKQMLDLMDIEIGDRQCFCICKEYLERFLGDLSFKQIKPEKAPKHLSERYKEYSQKGDVGKLIMVKREGVKL